MSIGNVQVAIKLRPVLPHERDVRPQWTLGSRFVARSIEPSRKRRRDSTTKFYFDHLFNEQSKNNDVFENVVKKIITWAVNGCNGTVIACGESGSGKTHTMKGTPNDFGIILQAVKYMFDVAENNENRQFIFRLSYFEIYNEKVNDLIDNKNRNLKLSQSINNLVHVVGCHEELVSNAESVFDILVKSEKNRKIRVCPTAPTGTRSNKSHTILRIDIENRNPKSTCDSQNKYSQLNLVDLAGPVVTTEDQSKEDFHIHLSFSILSIILVQLNQFSDTYRCIDFRESKLTQCLLPSFGGNAQTAFICTISPVSVEETQNTLWFAFRAASVQNQPKINTILDYKIQLVKKICKFHRFLQVKMKKLLTKLIEIQDESKSTQESDQICRVSRVMTIINGNTNKILQNSPVPKVTEEGVFSALQKFKLDLEELHDKLAYLIDAPNANGEILNMFALIERDLEHLEPKAVLLETFINILIED